MSSLTPAAPRHLISLTIFVILLSLMSSSSSHAFVQTNFEDLLPKAAKKHMSHIQSFPALWWNFIVIQFQKSPREQDWENLSHYCQLIKTDFASAIDQLDCSYDNPSQNSYVTDWIHFTGYLEPYKATSLEEIKNTLAKASLPMPRTLLDLLRQDPLGRSQKLLQKQSEKFPQLELTHGFLYDKTTLRAVLPIKFIRAAQTDDAPSNIMNSQLNKLDAGITYIGAHFSAAQNKKQVMDDISSVSFVTAILSLLLLAGILFYKQYRLFIVLPLLFLAIGISAITVYFLLGPMHALAISFGPGIVGLALDYSLHSGFTNNSKSTWRANTAGLLTTLAVFAVIFFSELPVLKQIALFSFTGLCVAFFLIYLFRKKILLATPQEFWLTHSLKNKKLQKIACLLFLVVLPVAFFAQYSLDMRDINFMDKKTQTVAHWIFQNEHGISPIFTVAHIQNSETPPIDDIHNKLKSLNTASSVHFSDIDHEGPSKDIPPLDVQKANILSWCNDFMTKSNAAEKKFFEPFIKSLACDAPFAGIDLKNTIPAFLKDFHVDEKWLTIWSPENKDEETFIRNNFPDAFSRSDMAFIFPATFLNELKWVFPVSIILCLLILFVIYKKVQSAVLATIPFFYALFFVMAFFSVAQIPMSFIAWIGLIIVFGFSLDYGVFIIEDFYSNNLNTDGSVMALSLSALTNLAGFLPMLFCSHPVLRQLGITLSIGAVGSYAGAVLVMPYLFDKLRTR